MSCRFFQSRNFAEGILVDTTELKKSNVELDRLRNELDQLIYHASHELRSPLVSMLGIINLVNIEKNLEASLSLNAILKEKVNQLDDLLKNISWIAYNNKNPFITEEIEWEKMIKSILKELQISDKEKVQLFYTIEQPAAFQTDLARVRTIIRNLISNSFKYFNPTSDNCWVNIKISVQGSHAEIEISDNGIGIDQEYLNKIFKMFYKATEYPKGPGLGLYIVKAMTEKLDGSITVESSIGKGSMFRVRIPNMDNGRGINSAE